MVRAAIINFKWAVSPALFGADDFPPGVRSQPEESGLALCDLCSFIVSLSLLGMVPLS